MVSFCENDAVPYQQIFSQVHFVLFQLPNKKKSFCTASRVKLHFENALKAWMAGCRAGSQLSHSLLVMKMLDFRCHLMKYSKCCTITPFELWWAQLLLPLLHLIMSPFTPAHYMHYNNLRWLYQAIVEPFCPPSFDFYYLHLMYSVI